uniref:Uncharacterized protein n=1 Tax=Glossina morsitans morsitans TaxID=37546 RepID=A0A1B0FRB6_GLOMM
MDPAGRSCAAAARKTKRPVKPAKTYPRTNATPSPQPATSSLSSLPAASLSSSSLTGASITSSSATTSTTTTNAAPSLAQQSISAEDDDLSGNVINNDSELPKPIESNGNAADMMVETKTDKPSSTLSSETNAASSAMIEEECDPDMIGFEIITG